jgi:hypothetical protein
LLFYDFAGDEATDSGLLALDNAQGALKPFLPEIAAGILFGAVVSPDGRWLAMQRVQSTSDGRELYELIVTSHDPAAMLVLPWDREHWADLRGWVSDNRQLMVLPFFNDDQLPFVRPDELILFDIASYAQQRLTPEFPYTDDGLVDYWREIGGSVLYDPTLTRVVYLDDDSILVLWNLREGREEWRFTYPFMMTDLPAPVWSPDGQKLVQAVQSVAPGVLPDEHSPLELRITGASGAVTQHVVTGYEFLKQFPNAMSWSPNGRYVSFFYSPLPQEGPYISGVSLLLWDTATETVLDYCLAATGSLPVWAPDSSQFIVNVFEHETTETASFRTLLADVDLGRVLEIGGIENPPTAWLRID